MKIAVTYDEGQIFQHFGHTKQLKIYTVLEKQVAGAKIINVGENGHGAMADLLKNLRVDVLICGGIGGGAKNALNAAGITFFPYVQGGADEAVQAYLNGELVFDMNKTCAHHGAGHDHGHSCGHDHDHDHAAECAMRSTCSHH